ncbi:MAG TPA: hypothetical protein VG652_06355 [Gaiellaceae bacterium]|nr:hypothetical protein [Gaiellaceae bacterium]
MIASRRRALTTGVPAVIAIALIASAAGGASKAAVSRHTTARVGRSRHAIAMASTTAVNPLPPSALEQGPPDNVAALPTGTAPEGVEARVISRAGGSGAAGGFAQFIVSVLNEGTSATTAGSPATLTFKIPPGLTFAGITDTNNVKGLIGSPGREGAPPGTTWICKPQVKDKVTCEYGVRDGGGKVTLVPIPGGAAFGSIVKLAIPAVFKPAANGTDITLGTTLSAPGNTATTDVSVTATTAVLPGGTSPALLANTETTPATVEAGALATDHIEFLNLGSGPAASSNGRPAIKLTNVLPPTLVNGWQASGAGWSCTGAQNASPSCSFNGTVEPGALSPRLTVTYHLSAAGVAALNLQIGGSDETSKWTMDVAGNGATVPPPVSYPDEIRIAPPAGSDLVIEATAEGGVDELLPGITKSKIDVAVTNLGREAASTGIGLHGLMPAGINVLGLAETGGPVTWTCAAKPFSDKEQELDCQPAEAMEIPAARTLHLALNIEAAPGTPPGTGELSLVATSSDEIASLKSSPASIPIVVLKGDVGFPALTLMRATGVGATLAPATDGSPAAFETGTPFSEQLDLRNAGGAAIGATSEAELSQTFTPGVSIQSIHAPPGWACQPHPGTSPTLTCLVKLGEALAPAGVLQGPSVTVTTTSVTKPGTDWPASVRLTAAGAPKAESLPVFVSVTAPKVELLPDLTTDLVPTAGGVGKFTATVQDGGDGATRHDVDLGLHLPRGVRFEPLSATGWDCVVAKNLVSARCISKATEGAGQTLPPVHMTADFPAKTAGKTLTMTAHVGDGSLTHGQPAKMTITPRKALQAEIKAPDTTAFQDVPLVSANEAITPSTITLEGDGSGGSGLGLNYTWTQLCTTGTSVQNSGGRCPALTPAVTWVGQPAGTVRPTSADVEFSMPAVSRQTLLVFQLTVTDGSATATSFVHVRELPETTASSPAFSFSHPHPGAVPSGLTTEKVKLPAPAETLKGKGARTPVPRAKKPAKQHSFRATSADPVTTTTTTTAGTTTTSSTTTTGTTTTGSTTTTTASTLPAIFCNLVRDAASGSFSATLPGGIELNLGGVSVTGKGCAANTTVSFSGSSVTLSSFLKATGVDGEISKDGITITSGTIEGPAAWKSPTLSISGDSSLFLAFPGSSSSASDVEAEGSVSGSGLAFIPLPSGWTGTTTLTFGVKSGVKSLSLESDAIGPKSDTSPGSEDPTISLQGSVSSDGTFSLHADLERIVQIQGHPIALSGTIARATPDGALTVEAKGSITAPFEIVPGLQVKTLSVSIAPTADSLGLTGEGTVEVTGAAGAGGLGVGVKLAYDNPRNWSLAADGIGSAVWEPVSGLKLSPSDVHGSISAKDDKYDFSLSITPAAAWTPTSSVSVANMKLSLSTTCDATGAPCPPNSSVFLQVSGDATFTLPNVSPAKATLSGVLGLPSGAFSVSAALVDPLSIGAGISIDSTRIEISKGMTAPTGTAALAPIAGTNGLEVYLKGSATLPLFGKLPTIEASYSSAGWSVAAPLGSYSLPGSSGDGSKLGDTIVGWSSYASKLNVVDPVTKVKSTIDLPANTFELSGSFATPSWLKTMLKLPADVTGRATGKINTSTGEFALRMEFAVAGNTYIYGNATSSSSIKLTKAFFQIEKKATDFNLALGGEAALSTSGTSSSTASGATKASSVNLALAISFSTATQTIAGDFSLNSKDGWKDAFGAKDLTLFDLAVSFQLNLSTLTPGIGFGARAVLPPSIRNPLGMPADTQTTLVANISLTNPCLGIEVTNPKQPGVNVLNLGSGAVTAKQFQIEIAPTGCTVGKFHYDPGLSIAFDGSVAGLNLAIAAHASFTPFAFDASLDVGEFSTGGLNVKKTHLEIAYAKDKFRFAFSGGVTVLGTAVTLEGAVEQNAATTKIDFKGTVSTITLGSVLQLKNLAVNAHVEISKTVNVAITASGSAELLGSSATANFSLGVKDGVVTDVKADVKAAILVGGAGGLKLDGTFHVDYGVNRPFILDAAVAASIGGYNLADGTVNINQSSVKLTANFSIGGVFAAKLSGAVYYGSVPAGTKIAGPGGTLVNAVSGDFVISAKDVTLNLGGFTSVGTVELGRANGTAWGNLATKIQLLGTGDANSVSIAGSFSGNGDFSFAGRGNLNLLGTSVSLGASVKKTGTAIAVTGDATVAVLGSNIAVSGAFAYDRGSPRFRMRGSGTLNLAGYNIASANFFYSNFPEDAGLSADVNVKAGSVLNFSGRLSISGNLYYLNANARLDLRLLSVDGNVTLTNCTFGKAYKSAEPRMQDFPGGQIRILNWTLVLPTAAYFQAMSRWISDNADVKPACLSPLGGTKLDANANFSYGGFSFGVELHVQPNGNFSATARTPASGEFSGKTGTLNLLVVEFYADLKYSMQLTVSNTSPYVDLRGSGSANVYGQSWGYRGFLWFGWSGWGHIIGINASFQTNPFKACGYVNVWGKSFGGCVG